MKEIFKGLLGKIIQQARDLNLAEINARLNEPPAESPDPYKRGGLYVDDSELDLAVTLESDQTCFIQDGTNSHVPDFCLEGSAESATLDLEDSETPEPEAVDGFLQSQLQQTLENRLIEAGLLSPIQLELALADQNQQPDLLLYEILLLRSWIKEQTLAFFLNLETGVSSEFRSLSLGERLQKAGLVNEADIAKALREQTQVNGDIGQILILNGVIRQKTADYFARL
ncbi:MAG: hypothetical protein VKJ46_09970 [Leptolyngbyaceae bacterium]|nr:hypothetical protein [Leptolyngbyaceae bacterium]